MRGLTPSTRYIIAVRACSPIGCTESRDDNDPRSSFTTPEEGKNIQPSHKHAHTHTQSNWWIQTSGVGNFSRNYAVVHSLDSLAHGSDLDFKLVTEKQPGKDAARLSGTRQPQEGERSTIQLGESQAAHEAIFPHPASRWGKIIKKEGVKAKKRFLLISKQRH